MAHLGWLLSVAVVLVACASPKPPRAPVPPASAPVAPAPVAIVLEDYQELAVPGTDVRVTLVSVSPYLPRESLPDGGHVERRLPEATIKLRRRDTVEVVHWRSGTHAALGTRWVLDLAADRPTLAVEAP